MSASRLMIVFISIIAVFGGGLLLISPKYQAYQALMANVINKENELARKEEYFNQLMATDDQLKEYEEEIAKVEYALADNPRIPSFLDYIQKAASKTGLIVKEIGSFSEPERKEGEEVDTSSVSFAVAGKYASFLDFLKELEKSARLINVSSIYFSGMGGETEEEFDFKIEVEVYSWLP